MLRRLLGVGMLALGATLAFAPIASAAPGDEVLRLELDGTVDPLAARYVKRGIDEASTRGAVAVLLHIDTPGGLDGSMRDIIRAIGTSKVPVACWVGPSGARAASAGAIITLGCPVAAMAEGTNIGAAHPVGFRGDVLGDKITNDAAAYARALAQQWGRNPMVAERMVRDSFSLSASDALDEQVVDLLANDEATLLRALAQRNFRNLFPSESPRRPVFATDGARVEPYGMSFSEGLLHGLIDPNLAYLLLVLGLLGIGIEVLSPGLGVPGIAGVISFVVAAVILGMLPVNVLGVGLILLAGVLFAAEVFVPGGIAAAGGVASLIAGGLFLFDSSVPAARVSRALIVGTAVSAAAFFVFVVRAVVQTRRRPPGTPTTDDLVGERGLVVTALEPTGMVRARNEDWTARSAEGVPIEAGTAVRIVAVEGLTLDVVPASEQVGQTPEVSAT